MLSLPQSVGHAILALSCLQSCSSGRWRLSRDIAACTDISPPYLAKILHVLGGAGLVEAKRGYRGGYALAREATEISLFDVADAMDAGITELRCILGLSQCSDKRACPAHDMWTRQRGEVIGLLKKVTIADVAAFEKSRRRLCCQFDGAEADENERVVEASAP